MKFFKDMLNDEQGATAIEYGLIAALIAVAAITAMGMRKNGHTVSMFQVGEAGGVIDEEILRSVQGFGLPPMPKILDDESMAEVNWYV